jgi:hypothetical protein
VRGSPKSARRDVNSLGDEAAQVVLMPPRFFGEATLVEIRDLS